MAPKSIKVALKTPFLNVEGVWEPNDVERAAAWELYIELTTRVGVIQLPSELGSDREVLASLHSLLLIHREVLRRYGPAVAEPKRSGQYNLGYLAVGTLNCVIRPFLATWHSQLQDFEARRPEFTGRAEYERTWPRHEEFRRALSDLRRQLQIYVLWLSHACNVPDLLPAIDGEVP